jgi:hypothetical protein
MTMSTQGAAVLEVGIPTTSSRHERSDPQTALAEIAGAQFTAIFDEATSDKASGSAHEKASDHKTDDRQDWSADAAPRHIAEGLALLQLSSLHSVSSNSRPDAAQQQSEVSQTTLPSPVVTELGASSAPAAATFNKVDAPKSMSLNAFALQLPAALKQAVSDSTGSDASSASIKDAPKRLTVLSLATHLPAAQAPLLSEAGALLGDANSKGKPALSQYGSNSENLKQAAIPATDARLLPIEGGSFGGANSNDRPALLQLGSNSKNLKQPASPATDDSFVQQLPAVAESAPLPIGASSSPTVGFTAGSAKTTASSAPRAVTIDLGKDRPSKVLTFQLEPEDLGAVTVRMQLTKTRVSLKIDVDSPAVQAMLSHSRDQLTEALSVSGHSVEEIAIRVSSAPVLSNNVIDARQSDSQAPYDQNRDGGALGGHGSAGSNRDERPFSHSSNKGSAQKDESAARGGRSNGASGVYL